MRNQGSPAARQAAMLFAASGVLRLGAIPLAGDRLSALIPLALANLLLAAVVWLLPWQRWAQWATLVLTLPACAAIGFANADGLIPPRTLAVAYVLVFVWVGSNHRRWASLWIAPLPAFTYALGVRAANHGVPLDVRAMVIVTAVCVLVAEIVARSQERLRSSSAEMLFLAEHTTDLVTRTDLQGVVRYVSPSVHVLLGWRPRDLVGQQASAYCHPLDAAPTDLSSLHPGQPVTASRRLRRADGSWVWFESVSQVVTGPDGNQEVLSSGRDITVRKQMETELEHVATHDPLTDLPNRVLLDERLAAALSTNRSRPLAVAFLDLDGFKAVNDQYGHEVGDRLLVQVARRLRQMTRENDTVARYGGDEFVLIIDGLPHQRDVLALAERVEAELAKPYRFGDCTLHIGASVGVTFVAPGMSASQAIDAADRAMYTTKAARRAQSRVPAPRDGAEVRSAAAQRPEHPSQQQQH